MKWVWYEVTSNELGSTVSDCWNMGNAFFHSVIAFFNSFNLFFNSIGGQLSLGRWENPTTGPEAVKRMQLGGRAVGSYIYSPSVSVLLALVSIQGILSASSTCRQVSVSFGEVGALEWIHGKWGEMKGSLKGKVVGVCNCSFLFFTYLYSEWDINLFSRKYLSIFRPLSFLAISK